MPYVNASPADSTVGIYVENPVGTWTRINTTEVINAASGSGNLLNLNFVQTATAGELSFTIGLDTVVGVVDGEFLRIAIALDTPFIKDVKLSHYSLSLNVGATAFFTQSGSPTCNVANNPCLPRYVCSGTTCIPCADYCHTCNSPLDTTKCTVCERSTSEYQLASPPGGTCQSEFLISPISKYRTIRKLYN